MTVYVFGKGKPDDYMGVAVESDAGEPAAALLGSLPDFARDGVGAIDAAVTSGDHAVVSGGKVLSGDMDLEGAHIILFSVLEAIYRERRPDGVWQVHDGVDFPVAWLSGGHRREHLIGEAIGGLQVLNEMTPAIFRFSETHWDPVVGQVETLMGDLGEAKREIDGVGKDEIITDLSEDDIQDECGDDGQALHMPTRISSRVTCTPDMQVSINLVAKESIFGCWEMSVSGESPQEAAEAFNEMLVDTLTDYRGEIQRRIDWIEGR